LPSPFCLPFWQNCLRIASQVASNGAMDGATGAMDGATGTMGRAKGASQGGNGDDERGRWAMSKPKGMMRSMSEAVATKTLAGGARGFA
jgi:hypothetical protein